MADDLLRALGRHQREDLERPADAPEPLQDDDERLLDEVFGRLDAAESPGPAPVIDLDARRRRWALVTVLTSVAAALVLGFWWIASTITANNPDAIARLPDYATSSLRGGPASHRSEPAPSEALSLRASDRIEWDVTPAEPVREPLAVALLAEPTAGPARLVPEVAAEISESGVVRLRGPLDGFVALEPGAWTLTLIIAAPDLLPRELAELDDEQRSAWQRVSIRVTITAQ